MLFPVPPQVLHRVKLGGISGEKLKLQATVLLKDKVFNQTAAMTSKPIPYHQELLADMTQQVFQKLHHFGAANRAGKQPKVEISPRHPGHGRQMFPVKMVLKDGSLTPGRPRPTAVRPFTQPALIDKHYGDAPRGRAFYSRQSVCLMEGNRVTNGESQMGSSPLFAYCRCVFSKQRT